MKVKDMVLCGMFTGILAILSQIAVPTFGGVYLTAQSFALFLAAFVLGKKKGVITVLIYILLGLCGLPVFANFRGGVGVILGNTGGFIVGFVFMVYFTALANESKNKFISLIFYIMSIFICHLLGIIWFGFITNTPLFTAFISVSLPFIPKDILSLLLSKGIGKKILVNL